MYKFKYFFKLFLMSQAQSSYLVLLTIYSRFKLSFLCLWMVKYCQPLFTFFGKSRWDFPLISKLYALDSLLKTRKLDKPFHLNHYSLRRPDLELNRQLCN